MRRVNWTLVTSLLLVPYLSSRLSTSKEKRERDDNLYAACCCCTELWPSTFLLSHPSKSSRPLLLQRQFFHFLFLSSFRQRRVLTNDCLVVDESWAARRQDTTRVVDCAPHKEDIYSEPSLIFLSFFPIMNSSSETSSSSSTSLDVWPEKEKNLQQENKPLIERTQLWRRWEKKEEKKTRWRQHLLASKWLARWHYFQLLTEMSFLSG